MLDPISVVALFQVYLLCTFKEHQNCKVHSLPVHLLPESSYRWWHLSLDLINIFPKHGWVPDQPKYNHY